MPHGAIKLKKMQYLPQESFNKRNDVVPYTEEDAINPWGLLWEFTILMKNYHIALTVHALQKIQDFIVNCHLQTQCSEFSTFTLCQNVSCRCSQSPAVFPSVIAHYTNSMWMLMVSFQNHAYICRVGGEVGLLSKSAILVVLILDQSVTLWEKQIGGKWPLQHLKCSPASHGLGYKDPQQIGWDCLCRTHNPHSVRSTAVKESGIGSWIRYWKAL